MALGKWAGKSKKTPARVKKILSLIRGGNFKAQAAEACGISESVFYDWQRKDPQFASAVLQAEAEAEIAHLRNIHVQGKKDWRASAFWLERVKHKRFGKKDETKISADDDVIAALTKLSDVEFQKMKQELVAQIMGTEEQK